MRKFVTGVLVTTMFLLSGCEEQLPEDELVDQGRAFEMEKTEDDLEASSFPMLTGKIYPPYRIEGKCQRPFGRQLLAGGRSDKGRAGVENRHHRGYVCGFSGRKAGTGCPY